MLEHAFFFLPKARTLIGHGKTQRHIYEKIYNPHIVKYICYVVYILNGLILEYFFNFFVPFNFDRCN